MKTISKDFTTSRSSTISCLSTLANDLSKAIKYEFSIAFEHVDESQEHEDNVNCIYERVLRLGVVSQEWFDTKLKYTIFEILTDLQTEVFNSHYKMKSLGFDFYFNEDTIKHFANDILHFVVMDCDYESKQERKQITIDLAEQITHYLNTLNYENSK